MSFFVLANWTGVTATFVFSRIYSYFLYNVYAPSVIVVVLSWVGFVLPRDTPPARVTLAVTAVLTIVTILTMLNSSIAKVGQRGRCKLMRKGIKLKSNITCLRVEVRWSSSHWVFQDTFKQRVSSQVGSGRKKVKTGDQKNKQTKSCELFFADFFSVRVCFLSFRTSFPRSAPTI